MKDCPFSLEGKNILITGASSGIGRSVAIECSKMGATLIITARNSKRLNETFCSLNGTNHHQIVADLSTEEGISILVESVPLIDGLVNNAGIVRPLLTQQIEKSDVDELFNINTFAAFVLTSKLLQAKKIKREASIVFTSSVSGLTCSSVGGALYSASKSALNGYVKGAALDLSGRGIRVNTVNPGVVETAIFADGTISPEQLEEDRKHYPLKRFGRPEDVAYAVIYLLSDAASWITGTNLVIDGGFTLL